MPFAFLRKWRKQMTDIPKEDVDGWIENAKQGHGSYAIACAILKLAECQQDISYRLKCLGLADATTPIANSIECLADRLP
jgi:hypothetical protein